VSDPTADEQLSQAAHKAVQDFVNAQHCKSVTDVKRALTALGSMTASALHTVQNGKMEKLS
jgi:hypothetical protein